MFDNNNRSFDSKLARSVQRDFHRNAHNYRLAKTNSWTSGYGKPIIAKSLPLASYALFFFSLFALAWSI
ncbi:MAG: hypothetical protein AAF614_25700 [Chloroflexota bacterium]